MRVSIISLIGVILISQAFAMTIPWKPMDQFSEPIMSIEAAHQKTGDIMAVAFGGNLYRSQDWGNTWTLLATPDHLPVTSVLSHPSKPAVWYCETNDPSGQISELWQSSDSGSTWHFIAELPPQTRFLAISPFIPGLLLGVFKADGSDQNALKRSVNNGATWQACISDATIQTAPVWHPTSSWECYWGEYRSMDSGETWEKISVKPVLAAGTDVPPTVYSAVQEGLFSSRDDMKSWWPLFLEPSNFVRLNNRNERQILTGNLTSTSTTVFLSSDGGASFSPWAYGLPANIRSVVLAADWLFFACASSGQVYTFDERPLDLDGTKRIDGGDLAILTLGFGSSEGEGKFNPNADFNHDGSIDGSDLAILSSAWGHRHYYEESKIPGDFPRTPPQ